MTKFKIAGKTEDHTTIELDLRMCDDNAQVGFIVNDEFYPFLTIRPDGYMARHHIPDSVRERAGIGVTGEGYAEIWINGIIR